METLYQELKELIISTLGLSDVTPEQIEDDSPLFVEGLGLDSLDALELVVALEEHYGIEQQLEGEEARKVFESIAALAAYVFEARTK